jgi:class 3 adenylate cyclase
VVAPAPARVWTWLAPFGVPLLALIVWLAQPALDLRLPASPDNPLQNPVHFWLITTAGLIALLLGWQMSQAAQRRADARLFLVALSVLSAAVFVMLHALSTPNVLVPSRNVGFISAAPVGLVVASVFAAASAVELSPQRASAVIARKGLLRGGLLLFSAIFAALSLLRLPPFTLIPDVEAINTPILFCLVGVMPLPGFQYPVTLVVLLAAGLFGWAGVRYLGLQRRRGGVVLLGLGTAFLALALTTLNLGLSRTWQLTWWQWHVLVLAAFALLAYSAYRQFRSEGSAKPIYDSIFLEETIKQVRREYTTALEALVAALRARAESGDAAALGPVAAEVAQRFDLSDGQVRVLEQSAEALASEREQLIRLQALVQVGQETSVIVDEGQLLRRAVALSGAAFRRDELRVGLVHEGRLEFPPELRHDGLGPAEESEARRALLRQALKQAQPAEGEGVLVLPLTVKGRAAGVLEVRRRQGAFAERDRYLLRSLASQLSVALENARLYRQIDALFRQYMPASVATALLADPSQAALGGAVAEVSVMFGDLRGFTTLSERMSPPELVRLLNRYYGAAAQVVLEQGGTIDKFMGDAMMALFNAPTRQPDHALRACRAALAMQRVVAPIAAEANDMPRFGIGINTGEALVGNIGSEQIRNYTVIGDTVNLASRLQTRAPGGKVLISSGTYAQVKGQAEVQPLGRLQIKGKEEPVEAFVLLRIRE